MDRTRGWRNAIVAVAILAGCSSRTTTTISAGPPIPEAAWTTRQFGSAKFEVPSNWPVRDLTNDPKLCVRFDVEAVYLGTQGLEPNCPARLVGRANAVQFERLDSTASGHLVPTALTVNAKGQVSEDQPNSLTTRSIVVAFPKLGVLVTASFRQDPSVAQRIVDSVAAA